MQIEQWWNFFYLCGSAAVTLTGLTFLTITLGSTLIRKDTLDQVHLFVSPICFHFIQVFILCCMTAIPHVLPVLLGIACIISAVCRLWSMPYNIRTLRAESAKADVDITRTHWIAIVYLPCAVYAALIAAGTGFLLGEPWAVEVLAASCLTLLVAAIKDAWNVVIWIAATIK